MVAIGHHQFREELAESGARARAGRPLAKRKKGAIPEEESAFLLL